MKAALVLALGLVAALVIGFVNTHTDELAVVIPVVIVVSLGFGFARPRRAWLWALLCGGAVPASQLLALTFGWHVPYPNELTGVGTSCLALVPALVSAYVGVGFRHVLYPERYGTTSC